MKVVEKLRSYNGRRWLMLGGAAVLLGCISPPPPASALPDSDAQSANSLATVEGFVTELDGQYTRGNGQSIQVTPGCHIVKTSADALVETHDAPYIFWRYPPVAFFRIDALARHRYVVDRSVRRVDNNRYNIMVVAVRVIDPNGAVVSTQQVAAGPSVTQDIPVCPG